MFRKPRLDFRGSGQRRQVERVPIDFVKPNPYQPRKIFSQQAIAELADSIRKVGLMQPLSVRKIGDRFELIAGERRLRACRELGWPYVDVIVMEVCDADSAQLAMIENLQRENLHFLEEAEGFYAILRDHKLSQEDLASRIGKSQSAIANKMRILKLPAEVKKRIVQHQLTERHARAMLRLPDEQSQLALIDTIVEDSLTVRETEELIESILERESGANGSAAEPIAAVAPPSRPAESRKEVVSLIRDNRIYINSIRSIIKQMQQAGMDVIMNQDELEEGLNIVISIRSQTGAKMKTTIS